MKRVMTVLAVLTLTVAVVAGCGKAETATTEVVSEETVIGNDKIAEVTAGETSADKDTEKTTFTLGFDATFAPYGYMDENGEYIGFDLDLAAEVCKRLGLELLLQPIDWDSKDMELSAGSIDCIWNGFTLNGREDAYTWSDPYVDNSQVFVVSADSGIETAADLAGKIVNVQADSSALGALEEEENAALKDSFAELIQVPEYNTAFMNLEAGATDAVAMDIGVAEFQMESRGEGYIILEEPLASEVYAIGFLKGNEALRDAVQGKLDEMMADGTFQEIAKRWGLEDAIVLEEK